MTSGPNGAQPGTGTGPGGVRASMHDVAALAGVSHMTVSRALNGQPGVRDETRTRVLKAVEEIGYTRDAIARAFRMQRAMRLGVLIDGASQHGPNSTLRAFERAAHTRGYAVNALSLDGRQPLERETLEIVLQGIDGLCLIAPHVALVERLRHYGQGLPVVVIKDEADAQMHIVSFDQHAGAVSAVNHLIELGHRSILHFSGPVDAYDSRVRAAGWRETLTSSALKVREPEAGDWTANSGYEFAREYDLQDATAIFVGNDQMAIGVVHGLHERGLRVPDDISVVGFDDVPEARHVLPALTTVRQDFRELGEAALEDLVLAVEGRHERERPRLRTELVRRDSSARPRGLPAA